MDSSDDAELTLEEAESYDEYFDSVIASDTDEEQEERVKRLLYLLFGLFVLISVFLLLFVGVSVLDYVVEFFRQGVF